RVGGLGTEGQIAEVELGNKADYDDTAQNLVTIDGKVYGSPAVIETLVLYYNKDLVSAAPTSFAELEALQKDPKFAFA
ncbi:extracellular solute-binding protein, partial [Streptococcus pyogenes]